MNKGTRFGPHTAVSKLKMKLRRQATSDAQKKGEGFITVSTSGYKKKKQCERCPKKKMLIIHHRDRERDNNKHKNLETLCRACHRLEHRKEINAGQRRVDVNLRRGANVSKSRTGNHYPKTSQAAIEQWLGPSGDKLRASRGSKKFRTGCSERMRQLMNDPAHIEKRKQMRDARKATR